MHKLLKSIDITVIFIGLHFSVVLHQGGTPTQRGASKFLGLSHYALHTMEGLINKLTINTFVFTIYLMSGGA